MKGMYHSAMPKGWTTSLLSDIAEVVGGLAKGKRHNPNELLRSVPYLRVANVQRGHLNLSEVKEIDATESEIRQLSLRPGDVLFNEGGDRDKLGRGWIWEGQLPVCLHQNHVFRARPGKGVLSKYLSIYGNHVGQAYFLNSAKQTTNLASISKSQLSALPVWLPPVAEQHRIVAKLNALQVHSDAAKAALDAIGPLLEKFRQSVLAAAFRGDLTRKWREEHPDVEPASVLLERIRAERRRKWEEANPRKKYVEPEPVDTAGLPELPVGWCWASLDEVSWLVRNGVSKTPEGQTGVPVLRISAVRPMALNCKDVRHLSGSIAEYEDYILAPNDLLFTRYNGNSELVGACAVVPAMDMPTIYPDKLIRVKVVERVALADLVASAMQVGDARRHIRSCSKSAAGQVGISGGDLKKTPIPVAPMEEQLVISSIMAEQFAALSVLATAHVLATEQVGPLTQSILAKAFRGELVPQDPNDEPASVLLERIRQEREGDHPLRRQPRKGTELT